MRIAIDASALGSHRGGDETHLRSLLRGLAAAAGPSDRFPLFVRAGCRLPEEVRGDPRFPVAGTVSPLGLVRFGAELSARVAALRPAPELLVTYTHAPLWSPVPTALVLGDLSFVHLPDLFPPFARLRLRALVPPQLGRARLVLVPSEFTRRDVIEHYRADPDRVRVVPPAFDPTISCEPEVDEETVAWAHENGARHPFVLYLGNLHRRKNVGRLIRAFGQVLGSEPDLAGARLLVAGAPWWGGDEERGAAHFAPPGSVVFLGRVSDRQRDYLLATADAVAYPSLFEGFGLPVLEAMAAGTPVVTSNTTSLTEVAGDAALLVDPYDVEEIAKALRRVLTDGELRDELRARGLIQARAFDHLRTGESALEAFESLRRPAALRDVRVGPL
jgi:glycosyltransferase involved in cell wall biosynthesis